MTLLTGLSHYFTHYRTSSNGGPWFAIGPVLAGRPSERDPSATTLDLFAGVVLTLGHHSFAIHRDLR